MTIALSIHDDIHGKPQVEVSLQQAKADMSQSIPFVTMPKEKR